jgi:hypothetical protein
VGWLRACRQFELRDDRLFSAQAKRPPFFSGALIEIHSSALY